MTALQLCYLRVSVIILSFIFLNSKKNSASTIEITPHMKKVFRKCNSQIDT